MQLWGQSVLRKPEEAVCHVVVVVDAAAHELLHLIACVQLLLGVGMFLRRGVGGFFKFGSPSGALIADVPYFTLRVLYAAFGAEGIGELSEGCEQRQQIALPVSL